jgi:hypothetical protein
MAGYWTEFVIGIIMIISPWILGFSDISLAKWCNVLIGLLLVLVGTWMMFGDPAPKAAISTERESKKAKPHKTNVEQK